jgi:thymidylate synthase
MHMRFSDVNDAFAGLVGGIDSGEVPTVRQTSRLGDVLVVPEPVVLTYSRPRQRVLLCAARDLNPFAVLFESLWMLAGRKDIAPLAYYSQNWGRQVQDGNSPDANGGYGYRWRHAMRLSKLVDKICPEGYLIADGNDQLKILIDHLREKPESRRAVLAMWNVEDDLLRIDSSRDVCCNLNVCFSIRSADVKAYEHKVLDMTVFNRSNDIVWGTCGSDFVNFSLLQEYVADCLGVGVGVYNQISNNLHAYVDNWKPEEWLEEVNGRTQLSPAIARYGDGKITACQFPLVKNQKMFDAECADVVDYPDWTSPVVPGLTEPFLRHVAMPMLQAFAYHKKRDYETAARALEAVQSPDWRLAGQRWIERRRVNWERKREGG